jgi:hypothetical protein
VKDVQRAAIFLVVVMALSWQIKSCFDHAARFPAQGARETANVVQEIVASFKEVLQLTPRIEQDGILVLSQQSPIEELAVLQRDYSYNYTWTHRWMGSEKKVTATGSFRAKAGFDLTQPFSVIVDARGRATGDFPPARILSVEPIGKLELKDEDGWLNRVSAADRNRVQNEFFQKARQHAADQGLLKQAEAEIIARLQAKLTIPADALTITFRPEEKK